jgi:hypothetical protein
MKSKLTIDKYGTNKGTKRWKLPNGYYHREDGPAIEYPNGTKEWYLNGELHREDGPAIEYLGIFKFWWINDRQYTEQEYKNRMRNIKLRELLT